ncbi:MAG: UPF0262 family protein [Rhodospirillales bacterium]|nr:UPF0262 family protein [Rhodospirillales bacterium]
MGKDARKLLKISLDEETVAVRSAEIEHERQVAIFDLLQDNDFALSNGVDGPYHVTLGIIDRRLRFDIRNPRDEKLAEVMLPLAPFRSVIRDYFTVCDAYYEAIKTASRTRIEAIDMGRRSLHDEGAEILRERLARDIDIDDNTSRRLFTLICVLHARG